MALPNLDELGIQWTEFADGNLEAKLPTGEVFKGNPKEVAASLAKSKVETRRYADDYKSKYEAAQHELESRQAPAQPQTQPQDPNITEMVKLGGYVGDAIAKAWFGPNATGAQLANALNLQQEAVQKLNKQSTIADFQAKCPDFPNTDEASDAVVKRAMQDFEVQDFDRLSQFDPRKATNYMIAAHRACVAEGVYQALNREQQLAASNEEALAAQRGSRPTPPPLVPSGNPEAGTPQFDPWAKDVKLEDLRAAAIRQQLGEK